jgi:hypothetical protein
MMLSKLRRHSSKASLLSTCKRFSSRSAYEALLKDLTQTVHFDSQNRITNIPETPYKLDASLDHAPRRTHTLTPKQVD